MKYQAVLWDWDGTLFDSDYEVWRATTAAYRQFNFPTEPYETFRLRDSNHFDRGLGTVSEEVIHKIRDAFHANFDTSHCSLVKHATTVLNVLERRSVVCAIVSAHRRESILTRLAEMGINHHFRHVVGGARNKESAIIETCERIGAGLERTLFVGDLPCDIHDGRAAGIQTVLYAPLDSPHKELAHHHITDLRQLIGLFAQ